STDFNKVFPLDAAVVLPTSGDLAALEVQSIYLTGTSSGLKPGQPLLVVGKRGLDAVPLSNKVVRRVETDLENGRTRVDLEDQPVRPTFVPLPLTLAAIRLRPLQLVQDQVEATIRARQWRERDLSAFLSIQGWSGRAVTRHLNVFFPTRPVKPPPPPAGRR